MDFLILNKNSVKIMSSLKTRGNGVGRRESLRNPVCGKRK
jgi:hypothetical protein